MKTLKTILRVILTLGVAVGLILMCGQKEDGSCDLVWSLGWMAEMVISGWLLVKLFPETFKDHVEI